MPLLSFWKTDPDAVLSMSIEQIVSSAGDGKLLDVSVCSKELRAFLREVPSESLRVFAEYCLTNSFNKSGQVLQDIVNELGRRLDFEVSNGLYSGKQNAIGYDGLWTDPDGHSIVVEVKTTDTYRISLDTIANYRTKLHKSNQISSANSMLVVVGRDDTGELEAQVRGSRHAWDMRLIGVAALLRLLEIKESTEELATAQKIRGVLIPAEFTRLDSLIDVLFSAAKDVEDKSMSEVSSNEDSDSPSSYDFTAPEDLLAKRNEIIKSVGASLNCTLIKKTRATYWDSEKQIRAVCTLSKRYPKGKPLAYWYAFHPSWDDFLSEGSSGVVVLGAMDQGFCFVIPHAILKSHLAEMNTTPVTGGKVYWHVKILESSEGSFVIQLPKSGKHIDLTEMKVAVKST